VVGIDVCRNVVRALRAQAPERQQLVWLVSVVAAMLATVFLPIDYVFGIAYTCVPIAVGPRKPVTRPVASSAVSWLTAGTSP